MNDDLKKIDINQGYFGLGGFISLDLRQQEDLLRVVVIVHNYASQPTHVRPLNIFLEASPGSGKSFFVKQVLCSVKKYLGDNLFVSKTFNLTTMSSLQELKDAFRIVQSINIDKKIPVVFFDEVDAMIENKFHSYPTLLAPMFDGKIFEKGNEFNVGPGIFFFATSKKLKDMTDFDQTNDEELYADWIEEEIQIFSKIKTSLKQKNNNKKTPPKLLDFLDRIDSTIFLPPTTIKPNNGNEEDRINQAMYLSTSMILKHYPQTSHVESAVTATLSLQLMTKDSFRDIDSLIIKSTPPIKGVFKLLNLPPDYLNTQTEVHLDELTQKKELALIVK